MSDIIQFINGVPQTDKKLNGYYELKKKQERNGRFLSKYWKLMDITAENIPHGTKIEIDLSGCSKEMLHKTLEHQQLIESISYAKMSEDDFKGYYNRVLDQCCSLLGGASREAINKIVGFF